MLTRPPAATLIFVKVRENRACDTMVEDSKGVTMKTLIAADGSSYTKELSKNYFYNLARSVRGCLLIRPDPDGTIA